MFPARWLMITSIPELEKDTMAGQGESIQLPVVSLSPVLHGQLEVGGRTTFIEFPVFFQGSIDGSTSSHCQFSGSERQSIFELRFGECCPALRATLFTGFFVALSNPVCRAVETQKKLSKPDDSIFFDHDYLCSP